MGARRGWSRALRTEDEDGGPCFAKVGARCGWSRTTQPRSVIYEIQEFGRSLCQNILHDVSIDIGQAEAAALVKES